MKRNWLQLALLIVALLAVNLQCLARCADENCAPHRKGGQKQPPCHGQQPQKQAQSPCTQAPLADLRSAHSADTPLAESIDSLPVVSSFAISLLTCEGAVIVTQSHSASNRIPLTIHLRI